MEDEPRQPLTYETFQDLVDSDDYMKPEVQLLFEIYPKPTKGAVVRDQLPLCSRILDYFNLVEPEFQYNAATMVLRFNRVCQHPVGKYATKEDKKLHIRKAEQFLSALESDSQMLINDYESHDFANCEKCMAGMVVHYRDWIAEIQKGRMEQEQARLRKLEQEKQAAEEKVKQERWAAYEFATATKEHRARLKELRTFDLPALVQEYVAAKNVPQLPFDATTRFFADRGTAVSREEWDWVMADATEADKARQKNTYPHGDDTL
jgi:hypothetical protein